MQNNLRSLERSELERKTANRAKDWSNKENIIFIWLGKVLKTRRILSANGRPKYSPKT